MPRPQPEPPGRRVALGLRDNDTLARLGQPHRLARLEPDRDPLARESRAQFLVANDTLIFEVGAQEGRGVRAQRQLEKAIIVHDLFTRRELPAERRHLDDLRAELYVCETKTPAEDSAIPKQLLNLIRMR